MFWFFGNYVVGDKISFSVIFENLSIVNYDEDVLYVIDRTDSTIRDIDKRFNCEIKIIDNLINYRINDKNYSFSFILNIDENGVFHYVYNVINNLEFPYIDKYDFEDVVFMEIKKNNNSIIVRERERRYEMILEE